MCTSRGGTLRHTAEWKKLKFLSKDQRRMGMTIKSSTRGLCGDGRVLYLDCGGD